MKVLFIISSSDTAFWLSEVTHPYWHLTERGVEGRFRQSRRRQGRLRSLQRSVLRVYHRRRGSRQQGLPLGQAVGRKARYDHEAKGRRSRQVRRRPRGRRPRRDLRPLSERRRRQGPRAFLGQGQGGRCDLPMARSPSAHSGARAGRRTTGYTLEGDKELERMFGSSFLIPHYPRPCSRKLGPSMPASAPTIPTSSGTASSVTGQNQQSASEYALVLLHTMTGQSPVSGA